MIQPNATHSNYNSHISVRGERSSNTQSSPAKRNVSARPFSLVVGILWAMLLLAAIAFLVSCTGMGARNKALTTPASTPTAPTTPSASPLEISTNELPVGAVQSSYSATLSATGGVPPYSWAHTSGQLPTGLALNTKTGTLAGTPGLAGLFSFTMTLQDSKAATVSTGFSMNISTAPTPRVSAVSPTSGPTDGGTFVTISGSNFTSGATVQFGALPAQSVRVVSSTELQAVTPAGPKGSVNLTVDESDGQIAAAATPFTFTSPPANAPSDPPVVNADVVVDANQTVSETGTDDLAAAKNIFASASNPESNGGLSDWDLISQLQMKRMRIINALEDCALVNGKLTGCSRLVDNLAHVKEKNLTPHVIVGQWAPTSIPGDARQWSSVQWAQYDALSYAIVNFVVNQYGGTGFSEALFEVGNEVDITQTGKDLWLTPSTSVGQGDASRLAQYDIVYGHWAAAVGLVAQQNPSKKIRVSGPATGFGFDWQSKIIQKYANNGTRLDVVTLHQYGANVDALAQNALNVRATLTANKIPETEIWVTEYGANWSFDPTYGAINADQQGAAWAIRFLLQCLKGTITGGSFFGIRDNSGSDIAGVNSNMNMSTWLHVKNSTEYPKPIANALSMVSRMAGSRKAVTVTSSKPDLNALASSDSTSASLVVANYDFAFKANQDQSKNENVTVAFKDLPFAGPVTVDRYLIDSKTSNLDFWIAAAKLPPAVPAAQLQKVESFSATSTGGTLVLPARQLGPSATSLWIVHR